ncbi:hypothetical protein [Kribbella sp. NPDC048915]|uniref:hypothetical protein n=1 Tax=Kribbella sp. NPDC048915 TaxID=3155148 RepID=UPI0033D3F24C
MSPTTFHAGKPAAWSRDQQVRSAGVHEIWALRGFALPGHVMVLTATGWQRGWLIGREHSPSGWQGLVQYEAGDSEITEYLPADRIASPDIRPAPHHRDTAPGSTV